MKKTVLFLFALMLSFGASAQCVNLVTALPDPDVGVAPDLGDFQGWSVNAALMEELAEAKFLVIQTEGVGNNADGFGGMKFAFQGGDPYSGWTDIGLNGDWLTFPRADGKIVNIALNIANLMGDKYAAFLELTDWAQVMIGYWPGGGMTTIQGLGITKAFLTGDIAKPAGAVDLNSNYGFVFEGAMDFCLTPSLDLVFDFNAETIGTTFPIMHGWGWPDAKSVAVVAADPLRSGNSLNVTPGNYDGAVYFEVALPDGLTVADIKGIKADFYFADGTERNGTVEGFIAPLDAVIGSGTNFNTYPVWLKTSDKDGSMIQVSAAGEWFTVEITRDQIEDEGFNIGRRATGDKGISVDFAAIDDATEFMFGLGLSIGGEAANVYFMDNITFVFDGFNAIPQVKLVTAAPAFGIAGNIVVNADAASIFDFSGRLVAKAVNGLNPIAPGLYIVKVGAQTVKVVVK